MRTLPRPVALALAVILLGALPLPAATAAAASTKGFWIRNYASHGFELTAVTSLPAGGTTWPNRELLPVGYRFEPGMEAHFEVDDEYDNIVTTTWTVLDPQGERTDDSFDLNFGVDGGGVRQSELVRASPNLDVQPDFQNIWILDPPGTTTELTAGRNQGETDPQQVADLARNLCAWDELTCQFSLVRTETATVDLVVDGPYLNNTCEDLSLQLSDSDTRVFASSWDVSVTMDTKLLGLFETSVKVSGGQTHTSTATFKSSTSVKIEPGNAGSWSAPIQVDRSSGVMRIDGQNTTWLLHMTIDSPQQDGAQEWNASPVERAQTPTEAALLPHACA